MFLRYQPSCVVLFKEPNDKLLSEILFAEFFPKFDFTNNDGESIVKRVEIETLQTAVQAEHC